MNPSHPPFAGPVQRVRPVRLSRRQLNYLRLRRRADVALALGGLVVAAIPMVLVALGVLVTMGRPVLFAQERMTQSGRIFTLWKFRSMRDPGPRSARDDAERLVPFGRFIRATSLDELPSLWNIVRGDMGLIGPRPLPTYYLGRFSAEQFARHTVPAGLTGHAQVHGRNEVEWDRRMSIDQEYVQQIGPVLDLQILRDTVGVVLRRRGVDFVEAPGESTDFPGPQATSLLELDGPADDGAWQCRDREDRVLLRGTVQLLGGGMVLIGALALGAELLGGGVLLEEALLLLVSRVRSRERTRWMGIAPEVELTPALREALERNGFVAPGPGSVFPTHESAPTLMGGRPPVLIAYVERPQPGFPPPRPLLSMWSEPGTSATPVPGLQ
ncbi:sugar transferase [Brachybacterium paraconglomeratum]|uniref:sugar transferase n=1 Tax=Brachybacterium paraconglomeratum TaxID=173362 RepID=UPI003FD1E570